jgi:EAL domain-containing protein (putative c-di-GMP-specific phosphodiesterase class I)
MRFHTVGRKGTAPRLAKVEAMTAAPGARSVADTTPSFAPVLSLASGLTTELELLPPADRLDLAFASASEWRGRRPDIRLIVSLEAWSVTEIETALNGDGLEPEGLVVEVTVDALPGRATELVALQAIGVAVAVGGVGERPVDLATLGWVGPTLVKVPVVPDALPLGVALGRAAGARVVGSGVASARSLLDMGEAGVDGVQGPHLSPPLDGIGDVLEHLGKEAADGGDSAGPGPTIRQRLERLEARTANIAALLDRLTADVGRVGRSAGTRSGRSEPPTH